MTSLLSMVACSKKKEVAKDIESVQEEIEEGSETPAPVAPPEKIDGAEVDVNTDVNTDVTTDAESNQ